ncbi:MAG TPA: asparaginase [Firmicutes bacterium]|nr:asparaginase [Candidatus Fermentithermobacillaceae bacterium]
MTQRRLDIITTGGTIASRSEGPMVPGEQLVSHVRKFFPDTEFNVHEICRKGSNQITTDLLWGIGSQVKKSFKDGANGVVITHGTDTLEETAYFLDLIAGPLGPIVVTGSMREFDSASPDGLANLVESCKVALEPVSAEYGVLVVMNDRIHLAREVTKVHSWLVDAIESPGVGPVGYAGKHGVKYTVKPLDRVHVEYTALVPPVDLIKAGLDSGARPIRALIEARSRGLVVESLGHGHLPPGLTECLVSAVKSNVPVVITTRCLSGGAPNPGTITESGFVTTDLSGAKARIKLMLALSVTNEPEEIAKMFAQYP